MGEMRTVVLDTNVLLADPNALNAFPQAHVIIPETVLAELDKLKTARVDPELRFRGREVSRALFELSETGRLTEGVDLPDGGRVTVVPLEAETELPEGLSARNPDDRILAVAFQVCRDGCDDLTLVTNDLNMLIKAQTLDLKVERHAKGTEERFARRFIIRPFQRYRIPLAILAVAIAVFAAVVFLSFSASRQVTGTGTVPAEFRDVLSTQHRQLLDSLIALERTPDRPENLLAIADAYYELYNRGRDPVSLQRGIQRYEQFLLLRPENPEARTDLATLYFQSGLTDRAIQEVGKVLKQAPEHVNANYNLGIFYWQGRRDYQSAAAQFLKVLDLTKGSGSELQQVHQQSAQSLAEVVQDAEEAGRPLPSELLTIPPEGTTQ